MFPRTNKTTIMMLLARIFLVFLVFVGVQSDDKADPRKQAMADIGVGMQGLKEAASDPAVLAQLLQDMSVSCCTLGETFE